MAIQNARSTADVQRLPNSPRHIGKIRLGLPLFHNKLFLGSSAQYVSSRRTWLGAWSSPSALVDFTATTMRLFTNFDFQFGVSNALSRRYEDPVYLATDKMPQHGRSAWVSLLWRCTEQ
jgi:outer membrane receptor protein involved in Fe transport